LWICEHIAKSKCTNLVQSSPALSDLWRINVLAGSQDRQSPVLQVVLRGHTHLCTRERGLEICRAAIGSVALYSVLNHSRALVTWLLTGSASTEHSEQRKTHELAHNSNWEHYNSCHWKHYAWRDTLLLWKKPFLQLLAESLTAQKAMKESPLLSRLHCC